MNGDTQDDMQQPPSSGSEKRAFSRNAIFLVGECVIPQQPARAIEILDFCPGGIFLSFPRGQQTPAAPVPVRGQIIEIRCSVPTANSIQSLRFQGRVARADRAGAGIAFINPSFEALRILHEFANSAPPEQAFVAEIKPEDANIPGKIDFNAEPLIRECCQMVEECIESMAKSFLEKAAEHCFTLAGEVRGIAEKNTYYAALNTFNKDGAAFTSEFLTRMQNRLRQTPLLASTTKKGTQAPGASVELSLIDDDVFDDWLAFTDMARAAELEHKEALYALERRLSALFEQQVDKENNPFGPGTISQIFQEALGTLAFDRRIESDSCKVFKDVLCNQTGDLYAELNRCLIDGGVLPVLHPPGKQQAQQGYSARKEEAGLHLEAEAPALQQTDPAAEPSITGLAVPPMKPVEVIHSSGSPVQPAAQASPLASSMAPVGAPPSEVTAPPRVESQATASEPILQPPQDWYQVMQALNNLQQNLVAPTGRPGVQQQARYHAPYQAASAEDRSFSPASAPGPDANPPIPAEQPAEPRHFTTDEVLSALSRIRMDVPGKQQGDSFHQDFMHKLNSELAVAAPSDESKEVPVRENNILKIGGNLFDSVLADNQVADTVKPWLNQLSIPLIKMALRDDSLFYDKSHLARQLINRIAELELFSADSKVENAVRKKIDGLLAEISGADEVTPDLLQKMLKEVSLLVHVQNKAYEGNIRDLVASCETEEQHAKLEKPANKASPLGKFLSGLQHLTGEEPPAKKDESLEEYRKRVRRLKVGNWLMLERGDEQKRIRLAWVAKNQDKFVFVNVQGLREETLNQDELAQYLRSGEVVVLEDGDEQLVDRAQSTMLQKMHHQLLHETTHDQLTGLINRREFEKRLAATLVRVHDSGMPSILCYFDLEQFSVVNNTFGYEGGDRALIETTRLLKQELGKDGLLARIGGDEFAMLIENCSLDDALRMASRLTGAFRAYRFTSEDKSLSLSFSAGLVEIGPESESIEALMQAAEASCRIARSKGSNYVQVYRPDEANLARHINSVKWVSRIDEALDKSTFELRCQPIVCISGHNVAVHHSEVLLRVPDDDGKLISPADLIMAAEHFRRMSGVDRWVIEHAFRWMAERRDRLDQLGGLAINLSGASLNEEGLIDFVISQAETHKIPMSKVCFEITETIGVSHLSSASEFINELKKQSGCSFSLDDFGSGQSSYAYLKSLPVDFLKIDGVFVDKMDQNPYDFAVVKSITEIGHFMGKKIIAERVESEAVLKMLRQIGVDYAQGYYLGKPRNMKTLGS
jgi:diguanylate cyclase (GGDEF)-like protein